MRLRIVDVEEKDWSQARAARFARACAVKMHLRMWKEPCRNPKVKGRDVHLVRVCAFEMHLGISQEQFYTGIYRNYAQAQRGARTQTHTLRQPAQSKCTWRSHKSRSRKAFQQFATATFLKINKKINRPRVSPERRQTDRHTHTFGYAPCKPGKILWSFLFFPRSCQIFVGRTWILINLIGACWVSCEVLKILMLWSNCCVKVYLQVQ